MKLAIVGSRDFNDEYLMAKYLAMIMVAHQKDEMSVPEVEIISGGAKGVDTIGEQFAHIYGVPVTPLSELDICDMLLAFNACDILLAFWDGKSKGTKHTIDLAQLAKKPTFIIYF